MEAAGIKELFKYYCKLTIPVDSGQIVVEMYRLLKTAFEKGLRREVSVYCLPSYSPSEPHLIAS